MPNPIEQIVVLAKKGDRRVLLGGAAVIGGGVGLIVYVRSRQSGAGGLPTLSPASATLGEGAGGGGAGGGADISSLFDEGQASAGLNLPVLDSLAAPAELQLDTVPSNLAGTEPTYLPELPSLTASPYFGSLPTLPAFEQPASYTGADYGNALTGGASEMPILQSALGGLRQAPVQTQPLATVISREIKAEAYTAPKAISQPVVNREIKAETYRAPAREIAAEPRVAPAREIAAVSTPRTIQADVYVPGQGAVLGGIRESVADYYRRAAAYVNQVNAARQTQAAATYTPPARSPYTAPTTQTARAETYTPPARTVATETRTAPRREAPETTAAARSTLVVKPKSRLDTLR